jgi:RNase P subunit RPR2
MKARKCDRCGALIIVSGRDVRIEISIDRSLCDECTKWMVEVVEGG